MTQWKSRRQYDDSLKAALEQYERTIGRTTTLGLGGDLLGRKNEVATRDLIRHFADGIGDPNPLWRDEGYARGTRHGGVIAPPMFVNAIALGMGGIPIPGFALFVAGGKWEWFKVIHAGDTITVTDTPTGVVDKSGKGRQRFLFTGEMVYRNQRGELVAKCQRMTMAIEIGEEETDRGAAIGTLKDDPYKYSEEELDAIEQAYQEEEIRGSNTRYWEDVIEGDEIKPVVKGPLTYGDMLAFLGSVGWMGEAHGLSRKLFKKYPEFVWQDPNTGIKEWLFMGHIIDRISRESGLPRPIALGVQACCWLGHLMTNWMGDEGFLKRLEAQCRHIICVGDTAWCRGRVTKKYVSDGEHHVDCEIWVENQQGVVTTPGYATVVLPSRNHALSNSLL